MACQHPFIARMDYAFDTSSLAIIVMEYCNGIDMAKVLRQVKDHRLPEPTVCFIAAEIVCALQYMHGRGLVYRDLKPGNILLNKDGHVQLIDLGTVGDIDGDCLHAVDPTSSGLIAQHGSASRAHASPSQMSCSEDDEFDMFTIPAPKRAMSVVGTLAFMAPEVKVMMRQAEGEKIGYSNAVDYWSLGATIYNLAVGVQPFGGSKNTATSNNAIGSPVTHQTIVPGDTDPSDRSPSTPVGKRSSRYDLLCPSYLSVDIKDVIGRFLDVNPSSRLVNPEEVRAHKFFKGIDWARLARKAMLPPYVPLAEESTRIPQYENFAETMSALNIEDWLDCAPPPALDKYFNEWKYVSEFVVPIEKEMQETTRRIKGAKKGTSYTGSGSMMSGSQSGSPGNSMHSAVSGHSAYSAYSIPLPGANTANLLSLKSRDDEPSGGKPKVVRTANDVPSGGHPQVIRKYIPPESEI
jgi:serine/threonine protein kinase